MMTEWFSGMLAIAAVLLCAGVIPLIRLERRVSKLSLAADKVTRISGALVMFAVGALVALGGAFLGHVGDFPQPLWFTWASFALWISALTMMISITGWLRTCLTLYAVWSGFCVFAVTNNWWS